MCDRWQEVIHLPGKEFAHPFAFDAWAQAPRGGMLSILAAIGLIEMISNRYYACVLPLDSSFRSCPYENQHRSTCIVVASTVPGPRSRVLCSMRCWIDTRLANCVENAESILVGGGLGGAKNGADGWRVARLRIRCGAAHGCVLGNVWRSVSTRHTFVNNNRMRVEGWHVEVGRSLARGRERAFCIRIRALHVEIYPKRAAFDLPRPQLAKDAAGVCCKSHEHARWSAKATTLTLGLVFVRSQVPADGHRHVR